MRDKKHIVHLTSVHRRYDTRIFKKMCQSIAASEGHRVTLVVADGKGNELVEGVTIVDVGAANGRIDRVRNSTRRVLDEALKLDGDLYHLHDPELIPRGLQLKKYGKKVIFDAHEDIAKQLKSKPYLNSFLRTVLPVAYSIFQNVALKRLDGLIGATPAISQSLSALNKVSNVNNYPIVGELDSVDSTEERDRVCFVGGITKIRGLDFVVDSLEHLDDVKLHIGGDFSEASFKAEISAKKGWEKVDFLGFIGREEVAGLLSKSYAGIVTYLPVPNHIEAQPNKMFEYMSAGVPVICSHFPLWREIIESTECGICVDPESPDEIAAAIKYLKDNPSIVSKMGENGIEAVKTTYNWNAEKNKLMNFYSEVLS